MRIDDEKDFVTHVELTLEEARDLVDDLTRIEGDDGPSILVEALATAIDTAQGQVFSGDETTAYAVITIASPET